MKTKQTDIAVFFGGKPKPASTKPVVTATNGGDEPVSSPAKRKSDETEVVQEDEAPTMLPSSDKKHKRLRKAGEVTTKTPSPGLEAICIESSAPTNDTIRRAAAVSLLEEEDEELGGGSPHESESETEEEEEQQPKKSKKSKKPKKSKKVKGTLKSPLGKVDGVGTRSIEAAAEHRDFKPSDLINWEAGKPVPFLFLANTFEAIAEESSRITIANFLINAFRAVIATTPQDLLPMVYLCTNRVAPAFSGMELGIGESTLIKALAQATGRNEELIKQDYYETGDLGVVAVNSRASQRVMFKPAPLTIASVYKTFRDIAMIEGTGSQERKKSLIIKLLAASRENEAGYVMRALQGKLRIGLAEQTVLVALSHALLLQHEHLTGSVESVAAALEKGARTMKRVYSECPSYDEIIPAALTCPLDELPSKAHFKPGVPVFAMLAKPTTGVSEVLDKFTDQSFTCEYKYDGERAQIHVLEDGTVKVYSRNIEDNTGKYPDIAALMPRALKTGTRSVVLDAEAVAIDRETGRILPFQVLSTRARKDVSVANIKVKICVFAFDCLYFNGQVLLREPLTKRREALLSAIDEIPGEIAYAKFKTSNDVEELTEFLNDAVEAGTEGLIVKTMDDSYEPSRRSSHWLKLKKDYMDGVGDTFDLVPIGAWYGKGKRTGVYGAYLLAIFDSETEEYQSITKIGTGFSEEQLKELAEGLKSHVLEKPRPYYRYSEMPKDVPDIWFDPVTVWEVKAADLSISPAHKAAVGLVDQAKGISIRFPRLIRVRDDKGVEDSTSPEQIAEMYKSQAVLQDATKKKSKLAGEDEF